MTASTLRFHTVALVVAVALALLTAGTAAALEPSDLERSTPRRAMTSFVAAVEAGDYVHAAELLDLRSVPHSARAARGPELARMFQRVLERGVWIDLAELSDDPAGRPEDGADEERIATVRLRATEVPISLTRLPDGDRGWVVSAATLARAPLLYDELGPSWLEERVPASLQRRVGSLPIWHWLALVVAALLGFGVGRAFAKPVLWFARRVTGKTRWQWDDDLLEALTSPLRMFLAIVVFRACLGPIGLGAAAMAFAGRIAGTALIVAVAWMAIGVARVLADLIERRAVAAAAECADAELRVRAVTTQVRVLRRVANVGISLVAFALTLLQFDVVRNVGMSLLASAGLAGIVIGLAAQRTIGTLIAGIQLSVTQPIRIGDVVIIENEWGTIEEVTLTYVVVRVWDERRLIVPMTRFLEQPFQNWTKVSPQLHGTVFLHVDWTLPLDLVRAELDRIVKDNPNWDGRTKGVVVTDAKERSLEIRVLVSAPSAGKLWDLRVAVREQLVSWLQRHEGGRYLPRVRLDHPPA